MECPLQMIILTSTVKRRFASDMFISPLFRRRFRDGSLSAGIDGDETLASGHLAKIRRDDVGIANALR